MGSSFARAPSEMSVGLTESLANIWLKAMRSAGLRVQNRLPRGIVGLTELSRSETADCSRSIRMDLGRWD